MGESILIDGNEYILIEDGIYKAKEPYRINGVNWVFKKNHLNFSIICDTHDDELSIVYVGDMRIDTSEKLYKKYLDLLKAGESVEYIYGLYSEESGKKNVEVGDLYVNNAI